MSVRTGFIARGFIPFSTHVVSFGYGGVFDELYPLPVEEPPQVVPGTYGPAPRGTRTRRAPCFSTEGPQHLEVVEPLPRVSVESAEAPALYVDGPPAQDVRTEGAPFVQLTMTDGPTVGIEASKSEEAEPAPPTVTATIPGAPVPVSEKQG